MTNHMNIAVLDFGLIPMPFPTGETYIDDEGMECDYVEERPCHVRQFSTTVDGMEFVQWSKVDDEIAQVAGPGFVERQHERSRERFVRQFVLPAHEGLTS